MSGSQDSDVESSQSGSDALSVGTEKSSQSGPTGNGATIVEGTNTVLVSAVSVSGKIDSNNKAFLSYFPLHNYLR